MAERGDARIEIWVTGITTAALSRVQERVADLLVAEGYGAREEEDQILSIVASFPAAWPDPEDFVADMDARGATSFLIPLVRPAAGASGGDRG